MATKNFGTTNGKSQPTLRSIEEQRLAQILAQPTWTPEQAAQVLADQRTSGQKIAHYAKQRGVTAGRISNWKTRLKVVAAPAPLAPASAAEPESLASVLDARLDLTDPGERFAHEYVQRATTGKRPMWQLFAIGRQGPLLLCVVRWAQRVGDSEYSLVQVALTEPALRWKDFPTVVAAREALERRHGSAEANQGTVGVPALVKVEVRSPPAQLRQERPTQAAAHTQISCITVCMRSGVRIQIPDGAPEALIRTVLWTLRTPSC